MKVSRICYLAQVSCLAAIVLTSAIRSLQQSLLRTPCRAPEQQTQCAEFPSTCSERQNKRKNKNPGTSKYGYNKE
eukprot:2315810-Amphidinium_carterae.2